MPVLLAAMLVTLIGMTGLAVDYGFAALERRVLQNAVDAAAVTGANSLSRGVSPVSDVSTIASRNNIALSTSVVCEYLDNSNAVTGSCSTTPSGTTSGVKVTATNDRATFFMRVLGVPTVTVSATSMARVYTVTGNSQWDMWASVFIVCGWNTTTATQKVNGKWDIGSPTDLITRTYTPTTGGSAYPAAWPATFNPTQSYAWEWPLSSTSVYNTWFVVHDENDVAKCGIGDSGFKGLNSSSGTFAVPTPSWSATTLTAETGARSGPATTPVPVYQGCPAVTGPDDPGLHDCIMFLPIFTSTLEPPNDKVDGDYRVRAVRWQPFWIKREIKNGPSGNTNTHYAQPRDKATVVPNQNTILAPWTKNDNAIITAVRTVQ